MQLFSKKLPAWTLLAALVIVGAGAATGLVLKDQIDGTTTIAVSQALLIDGAPVVPTAGSDHDEFLGTADDDGSAWAAHFEANNGDTLVFLIPIVNEGEQDMAAILTLDIPEGITVNIEEDPSASDTTHPFYDTPGTDADAGGSGFTDTQRNDNTKDISNVVRISQNSWKFFVDDDTDDSTTEVTCVSDDDDVADSDCGDTQDRDGLTIYLAIEDAQPTGFYSITGTIVPVNV